MISKSALQLVNYWGINSYFAVVRVSANASRFQHIIEDELIPGQMKERIDAARR